MILSDLGIAITMMDFRVIVKKYLTNDKTIQQFKIPGYELGTKINILERNPDLKIKVAHNNPRRAQVNREHVEGFFANLFKEIEGIPLKTFLIWTN